MESKAEEQIEGWDSLVRSLGLTPKQATRMREAANALKDAFATLMAQGAADGQESPLEILAFELWTRLAPEKSWAEQGAALHEAYSRFMAYSQGHFPEGASESYAQQFGALLAQFTGDMEAELDQRQRALFRVSLAPRALEWPTGHDPFGARVAAAVAAYGASSPSEQARRDGVSAGNTAGAPPVAAWEEITASSQAEEWSSLALLQRALGLDEAQAQRVEACLNDLKDEVARLMVQSDAEGATPASRLAEISAEEGGMDSPAVKGRFMAYLCGTAPAGSGESYQVHFTVAEEEAHRRISSLLTGTQAAAFRLVPAGALPEIRTGYDPVGPVVAPYIAALKGGEEGGSSGREMGWSDFCGRLGLEGEQAGGIRGHLERLQEEFEVLFEAPATDGAAAPRAYLRRLLAEGTPEAEAMARFQEYAKSAEHHLFHRSYASIFAQLEGEIRGAVLRVLNPAQQGEFHRLGLESLLQVRIEERAEGDAAALERYVQEAANELKDAALALYKTPAAHGGASPLEVLVEATQRDRTTAAQVFQRYITTHSPEGSTASYARQLQVLDEQAREKVFEKIPEKLRSSWEQRVPPLLLSLDTGYNPLLASLRALLASAQ